MRYYDDERQIYYEVMDDIITIVDADKRITELALPEAIDGKAVRGIGRKAFLGCKLLSTVELPNTIDSVGEWAFAYCDNLTGINLPRRKIEFGKGVYKGDERLSKIMVRDEEISDARAVMTSNLLAVVCSVMDAEYMLNALEAGTEEWLLKWDTRLDHMIFLRDDDGYHLYVLCGEEDLHFDYDEYMEYNRERKAFLCMLRLVNDINLNDEYRKEFTDYILNHTKGCESEAAFKSLLKRHGDDKEYYRMMIDIGAINSDNLEAVLADMGQRHAEMKSFLMEECGQSGEEDFFDNLLL